MSSRRVSIYRGGSGARREEDGGRLQCIPWRVGCFKRNICETGAAYSGTPATAVGCDAPSQPYLQGPES